MFEAARTGNSELLLAAIDGGLPVNILNSKGQPSFQISSRPALNRNSIGNSLLMLAAYGQ
jgi:hypothetical protein